jgi:glucose-6-phosphate-specific signal transduction histidine kinase
MKGAARRDFLGVVALTLLIFVLSVALQLNERLAGWMIRFEAWQVDELPLSLVVLGVGLAWFAWRRQTDAQALLAQNRELAQQLIAVQESERVALARELHDEMAQHCTAIRIESAYMQRAQLSLQGMLSNAGPTAIAEASPARPIEANCVTAQIESICAAAQIESICAAAQRAAQTAEQLQHSLRGLLRRLRPPELDELGLVAALQAMCQAWQVRTGVVCVFAAEGQWPVNGAGSTTTRDTALYRVAQEALSNVMRHAQARQVRMSLNFDGQDGLALTVSDDGCGFEHGVTKPGLGLRGAQERAAIFGGQLQLSSAPGLGTSLRLHLPHLQRERAA